MRKLATAAFAFAAGVFLAQYLLPYAWQLPLGLFCVALAMLAFLWKGNARRRILLVFCGAALALVYNSLYICFVQLPAEELAGSERKISMTVLEYAVSTEYGAKVTVRPEMDGLCGVKAVYYGDGNLMALEPGNVITDVVQLNSASRIRDDDITTFTSKGVFLLAYSRGEAVYSSGTSGSPRWLPQYSARLMRNRILQVFSGDTAAFLTAILTGDKSGISQEASAALSEAGLYHVLAVSGMHCAYLLGMVTFLAGSHRRRLQALIAIPLLVFYMLLAGGSPSVVRACIMLIFVLIAPLFRRESDMATSMSVALAVILLQNPFAAASLSLQLSFAAISGVIWAAPALQKLFGRRKMHGMAKSLFCSLTVSVGIAICTVPLTVYYFNQVSLIAPLSNLLCLWAAGFVFTLGLLAVLLSFVWMPLGMLLGIPVRMLIWYLLKMAGILASVPYHAVYFSNPYLKYWLFFAYGLYALCRLLKPQSARKYVIATGLCIVSLAVSVWAGTLRYARGELHITMLDVGQGASSVVSSGNTYGLIDCGSSNSWYHAGEIAAETLHSMGCRQLDYLMLTHYDSDHVSGVRDLMSRMSVKTILMPDSGDESGLRALVEELAEYYGSQIVYVTSKTEFPLGEAIITVCPPVGKEGDNQLGLTFLCSAGEYDFLVTGDMNVATEALLLEQYVFPDIEVLAVGHHGSSYSTSSALLTTLSPETALISVGDNSYGHPSNQTIRRLLIAGAEIFRTDLHGNIHITLN